jgi:hypothetical protein
MEAAMQAVVDESELKDPFSADELSELEGLVYRRPHLERLLEMRADLSDGFHRYLLRNAAPDAIAYNRIMCRFDGDPSGVEFKSSSRAAWAFVLPDASEIGKQRVQYFDGDGFFSHSPYATVDECVDAMVSEGYVLEDVGALDTMSQSDRWSRGVEVARLMQLLNSKQITFREFCELRGQL